MLLNAFLVASVVALATLTRAVVRHRISLTRALALLVSSSLVATFATVSTAGASSTHSQHPLKITNTSLRSVAGTSVKVKVSGGSGAGAVKFAVKGAHCSIGVTTGVLRASAATTCAVDATKAASKQYRSATSPTVHFVFAAAAAALKITNKVLKGEVGLSITVTASGGAGSGAISFDTTGSVCSINPATGVLFAGAVGSCPVTATRAASGKSPSTTSAAVTFVFGPGPQAKLVIANTKLTAIVGTPLTVFTSGGSGTGAVSFSVTGTGCTIDAASGSLNDPAAGTCTVTAKKAASASYLATTSASVVFTFGTAGSGSGFDNPTVATPDVATLTGVTVGSTSPTSLSLVNATALGDVDFIDQYYNNNDHWYGGYIAPGSTVTLTWHVAGSNGQPLTDAAVSLDGNLEYSCSNGLIWNVVSHNTTNVNLTPPNCNGSDQGSLAGTTDANGNVSFTLVDDNTTAPAVTNPTSPSALPTNEGTNPWTAMVLQVGSDIYTGVPSGKSGADINEQTDRVDFVVAP